MPSSDSGDEFESHFKLLDSSEDLFFQKLDEPTKNEKQTMCTKSYMSGLFDQPYDDQMVKTTELYEYREFDSSLTPNEASQVFHFEEGTSRASDSFLWPTHWLCLFDWGDHRLWVALSEKIPFVPCHVIPQWLPPNGSFKNVNADLTILQSKEVILPEHLALTVLNGKQVQS